jgi:hypothetical protein
MKFIYFLIGNFFDILFDTREYPVQKRKKWDEFPKNEIARISRLSQNSVALICYKICKFRKFRNIFRKNYRFRSKIPANLLA